jgi:hypothetical protein
MDDPRWLESLRDEFARRKLPPHETERMMLELTDHFHDFMEDHMSKDANNRKQFDQVRMEQALGSPSEIATAASKQFRRRRFSGRHPLLVFAVLPVVSLPLLSFGLMFLVGWLLSLLVPESALLDNGVEPTWHLPLARAVICGLVILPAIGLAALLCRAARKATLDWKWPLTACLLLALVAGSVFSQIEPKTATKPGLLMLGVGTPSSATIGLQAIQLFAPIAIGLWVLRRERMAAAQG